MHDEQERILLHLLDKLKETVYMYDTQETVQAMERRIVDYVNALVDGTHFLSICTRPDHRAP